MPEKYKPQKVYGWRSEKRFLERLSKKGNRKALEGYIDAAANRQNWDGLKRRECKRYAAKCLRGMV